MMDRKATGTNVVFYSRSGHSKRLASRLAADLQTTTIELTAPAYEARFFGYARAGFDSLRQTHALGPQTITSLDACDHVVICGPVWTSYPAVPLRGVLRGGIRLPHLVSLFLTAGSQALAQKAIAVAQADLGRPFVATAALANADEGTAEEERLITTFLSDLLAAHPVAKTH